MEWSGLIAGIVVAIIAGIWGVVNLIVGSNLKQREMRLQKELDASDSSSSTIELPAGVERALSPVLDPEIAKGQQKRKIRAILIGTLLVVAVLTIILLAQAKSARTKLEDAYGIFEVQPLPGRLESLADLNGSDEDLKAWAKQLSPNLPEDKALREMVNDKPEKAIDIISPYTDAADKASFNSWMIRGRAEFYAQEIDGAITSYSKALSVYPDNLTANMHMAAALLVQSRPDDAIKYADNAVRLTEAKYTKESLQYVKAQTLKAGYEINSKKYGPNVAAQTYDDALEHLEKITPRPVLAIADIHSLQGELPPPSDPEKRKAWLQTLLQSAESYRRADGAYSFGYLNAMSLRFLALERGEKEDQDQAIKEFEPLLTNYRKIASTNKRLFGRAMTGVAGLYYLRKDMTKALGTASEAISVLTQGTAPVHNDSVVQCYYLQGASYLELGYPMLAVTALENSECEQMVFKKPEFNVMLAGTRLKLCEALKQCGSKAEVGRVANEILKVLPTQFKNSDTGKQARAYLEFAQH